MMITQEIYKQAKGVKTMELKDILELAEKQGKEWGKAHDNTPYSKTRIKIDKITDKIERLQEQRKLLEDKSKKQLKKHCELLDNLPRGNSSTILKYIAEELLKRNPELKSYEILGPFGLNCELSIWFFKTQTPPQENTVEQIVYSLTFHGHNEVWTGKESNLYSKGSIGYLNGDNRIMVPVESIEQLDILMKTI